MFNYANYACIISLNMHNFAYIFGR